MSESLHQQWKSHIAKHLGYSVGRKYLAVMLNILTVDLGLKPAYLYDIGAVTGTRMQELMMTLLEVGLIQQKLNVVVIAMDVLVVNVPCLISHLASMECDIADRLVDVSFNTTPHVCSDAAVARSLVGCIKDVNWDSDKVALCQLDCSASTNVTSIFGILLGYPVIYWYDTADGDNSGNCLSMEELCCVQVLGKYDHSVRREVTSADTAFEHCLYSFSYPSCLTEKYQPLLTTWFKDLKSVVSLNRLFDNVRLLVELRCYPSLNL